jgi:prepilin-type N-terminal cleavage/methylation domain-containing protein
MKKRSGEKGLTLIEMIIAAAVLAVAGVAVAGLFVNAHANSRKALDIDKSTAILSSWIEEIKASPEEWTAGRARREGLSPVSGKPGSYQSFYDRNWQPIPGGNDDDPEAEFRMTAELYEMPGKPGLWTIEARMVKIKPYPLKSEANAEILKLTAMTSCEAEVGP